MTALTSPAVSLPAVPPNFEAQATDFVKLVSPIWQRVSLWPGAPVEADEIAKMRYGIAALGEGIRAAVVPANDYEVANLIAGMLACMTGNKIDNEVFARMLKADVAEAAPSIGALDRACRRLRQTATFTPSIAEVLAALHEAERETRSAFLLLQQAEKIVNERTQ